VSAIGRIREIISEIDGIQATIASAVEEQSATTEEITRRVTHAANGTAEIARNIAAVAVHAESTSADVAATEEVLVGLAATATRIEALVSNFQIDSHGTGTPDAPVDKTLERPTPGRTRVHASTFECSKGAGAA
jgi:phage-related minor tail protein